MFKSFDRVVVLAIVGLFAVAGVAAAQDEALSQTEFDFVANAVPGADETSFAPTGPGVPGSPDWGIAGHTWYVVPAGNCTETENQDYVSAFGWYRGTGTGSYRFWDCPMDVPTGSLVYRVGVEADDSDPSGSVGLYIRQYDLYGTSYTTLLSENTSTAGTPGKHFHGSFYPDITMDNHMKVYGVRIRTEESSSTQWRSLYFGVMLQISPAPGVATFPDVAPGFWAFQAIEALAASGITTGYPDGTYRPFEPVTRAQMATFLARALGLHWGP
jgi:hypothetical protein